MQVVCFKVPKPLNDAIERKAQAIGISKSQLIRDAIINYINNDVKRIKVKYVVLK